MDANELREKIAGLVSRMESEVACKNFINAHNCADKAQYYIDWLAETAEFDDDDCEAAAKVRDVLFTIFVS